MSVKQIAMAAAGAGGGAQPVFIEDVFSTWLYTGNGSTQTITNGIDLAGKGGLAWIKSRTDAAAWHNLFDTARGAHQTLVTNNTDAQRSTLSTGGVSSFNSSGFTLVDGNWGDVNENGIPFASWTFAEQAKFFDLVTYTGNGGNNRSVLHNLGSVPGCVIVKRTDSTASWFVWHRSIGTGGGLLLDQTDQVQGAYWGSADQPTSTNILVSSSFGTNINGATYVAYIFAHNAGGFGLTGTENVISCGSFDNSSTSHVTLGWEPQWLLVKSKSSSNWHIIDVMRGMSQTQTYLLTPNLANAENTSLPSSYFIPTATGFTQVSGFFGNDTIYIAIRRGPMRVPTDATKVFAVSQATEPQSTPLFSAGFSDMTLHSPRITQTGNGHLVTDRLRGNGIILQTQYDNAEQNQPPFPYMKFDSNAGSYIPANGYFNNSGGGTSPYVMSAFRRAPGFFDVVCYTGDGVSTGRVISHNLGVVPELIITKIRNGGADWRVWSSLFTDKTSTIRLNSSDSTFTSSWFNQLLTHGIGVGMTATQYSTATGNTGVNGASDSYFAMLFASCPGVSKVGIYTGTGTAQNIDCGFTAGARFVLIKRIDATANWVLFDSARGIVAGNDPFLLLNSTAAEDSGADIIDPFSGGFALAGSSNNVSGGTYLFLAIA